MHLTKQQFENLQRLAALRLTDAEKETMMQKMDGVIALLGKVASLDVTDVSVDIDAAHLPVGMYTHTGVEDFPDTVALLANVQHTVSGNAIAIQSFVEK